MKKSTKALNYENLINLGAEKLAELLLEVSEGSAETKRRLRLELSYALGTKALGSDIRKRLAAIKRSQKFIDWREKGAFTRDLDTQCEMIIEKIAPDNPALAFDLLWQFLELAESVYERVDDSNGYVGDVFRYAITRFEVIGPQVGVPPDKLAEMVFQAVCDNDYGQYDDLIAHLGPALGEPGLTVLKSLVKKFENEPLLEQNATEKDNMTPIIGRTMDRPTEVSWQKRRKSLIVTSCLKNIADQRGDVDAYIAQHTSEEVLNPNFAAEVANRLLAVDRVTEALEILMASRDSIGQSHLPHKWDAAYIHALDKLGRTEELYSFRWKSFKETLSANYLRDLLKPLPDPDAIEVEEQAMNRAMRFPGFSSALHFFLEWPDLRLASELIITRSSELDGDFYHSLSPAADDLQGRFPLASVLVRRAMISYNLENAKSTRYKHAARHLLECRRANKDIDDYKDFATHEEFEEQLRTKHARKVSFWNRLE